MTVVADQQGQPIGLTGIIGVGSAGGKRGRPDPGGKVVMALLPTAITTCLLPMPQHEGQLFESTSFIYQEVVGVEGDIGSGDPVQRLRQQTLQLGAKAHHLPTMISTGLWPSRARAACASPSSVVSCTCWRALHPATTRATGTSSEAPAASSPCRIWAACSSPMRTPGCGWPGQPCQPWDSRARPSGAPSPGSGERASPPWVRGMKVLAAHPRGRRDAGHQLGGDAVAGQVQRLLPPRPNTRIPCPGRTTRLPVRARASSRALISSWVGLGSPQRLPTSNRPPWGMRARISLPTRRS